MCVMFDTDNGIKYNTCQTAFLKHPDSGPNVTNDNKCKMKMSRSYKEYKAGKLTADMGTRKRNRQRKHLDVETALISELQYRHIFEGELITKKKDMRQIAMQIANK